MTSFGHGQLIKKTGSSELKGFKSYTATAYCLTGKTATGRRAGAGIIAVDPRIIPLGSRVEILGLGTYIAADTGGAIKGNKIDVWMPCSNAKRFGRKQVKIRIL